MRVELDVHTPSEFSQEFHQGMVNRMEISFHKYGKVMDAKGKVDEAAYLLKRVGKYRETGNTEKGTADRTQGMADPAVAEGVFDDA